MTLTALTSRAAAALVAAVAGFASYRHIFDVATRAGEHRSVSAVLPLAIDGLILVATLAMLDDRRQHRRPRLSARVALVFGILATLAANIASAHPSVTARMVAAVPAVSFMLAVEVLARSGRPSTSLSTAPAIGEFRKGLRNPGPDETAVKTRPASGGRPSSAARVRAARAADPAGTVAAIATAARVSARTARRHLNAG